MRLYRSRKTIVARDETRYQSRLATTRQLVVFAAVISAASVLIAALESNWYKAAGQAAFTIVLAGIAVQNPLRHPLLKVALTSLVLLGLALSWLPLDGG